MFGVFHRSFVFLYLARQQGRKCRREGTEAEPAAEAGFGVSEEQRWGAEEGPEAVQALQSQHQLARPGRPGQAHELGLQQQRSGRPRHGGREHAGQGRPLLRQGFVFSFSFDVVIVLV